MQLKYTIHLFEIPENLQNKIYCFLEEDFKQEFFSKLLKKYETKVLISKKFGVSEDKIRGWVTGRNIRKIPNRIVPIQVNVLFKIGKDLNYEPSFLERKIIGLKTYSKSKMLRYPKLPIELNYEFGRIIGSCLGDGHLTKNSTIIYSNTNLGLIMKLEDCVKDMGEIDLKEDVSGHFKTLIVPNIIGVFANSLGVPNGNKTKMKNKVKLDGLRYFPRSFKLGLVSSLMDDEGSVIKDGKIKFKQTLPHIVNGVRKTLNEFGIVTSRTLKDGNQYAFYVYRKSERPKIRDIGLFTHDKKVFRLNKIIGGEKIN